MSVHKEYDDSQLVSDFNYEEEGDALSHKKRVRRMIEDKLELRRLKEELDDELEGEFDWKDFDR